MKKICENCKQEFNGKSSQRFCSKKCCHKKIEKILKECEIDDCKNTFWVYPNAKNPQRLCSRKCQIMWQKENMRGDKNPNFGNRKPNMFSHTEETKKIIKEKVKKSWESEERLFKHLQFFERHRLDDGSMDWHTNEFREKISKSNINNLLKNKTNFSYKNCLKGFF